jgi:hypothetical protein
VPFSQLQAAKDVIDLRQMFERVALTITHQKATSI